MILIWHKKEKNWITLGPSCWERARAKAVFPVPAPPAIRTPLPPIFLLEINPTIIPAA